MSDQTSTAIIPIPSDEIREAVDLPLDPRQAVHVRHDDLAALVAEVEALRALVVQAHRDSWSDEGEQMWACRGLVALTDEQTHVLLRALVNGS